MMRHPARLFTPVRRAWPFLALAALLLGAHSRAPAQDPIAEFRRVLLTRPPVELLLATEKQQPELKKFYEEREQKLAKIIDTRLKSFNELRQALVLKDWGEVIKTGREDPQVTASDARLRYRIAQRFRNKVHAIVEKGDDDSKAAVANLLTELGLTVRAAVSPEQVAKGEDTDTERRAGFARSMTDDVIRLTHSDNEYVRMHALRALAGINADPRRAAPEFAAQIKSSSDVKVRRVAADGLMRLVSIAAYLRDQSERTAEVSASPLEVITAAAEVVRHAQPGLQDGDPIVRLRTAQALKESARVLSDMFKKRPQDLKQLAPSTAYISAADVAALKETLRAFQDAGAPLASVLQDASPEARLAAVETLERLSEARFRINEEPVNVMTGKVPSPTRLDPPHASDPLAFFAKDEWRRVARLLGDPDPRVRRAAVSFLEYFPEARPGVVPDLTRALSDHDKFVRWGAARALGIFSKNYEPKDAVAAVPALAKMLFDIDFTDRLAAASTLESLGPYAEAAVPDLARAVHFGDVENRVAALFVIQSIGPERTKSLIPSVTDALEQPDARVRRTAAETLGRYGRLARNQNTLNALRRALGDEDQEVRLNASEAVLQILNDE
jgi:HEAT repeat protein